MPTRERRALSILALVDEFRGAHPELGQPLRWRGLQRLLERSGISVGAMPIPERAFIQGFDGDYHVTVRAGLSARVITKVVLHELGHAVLHMAERGEVVRQLHECTRGDVREQEADLFAALLWFGPEATPTHPVVGKLVAQLEAPRFIRRMPEQIALPIREPMPVYRPRQTTAPQTRRKKRKGHWWDRVGVPRRMPGAPGVGVSHDALRHEWREGRKVLRWFHYDLGWIEVRDGMRSPAGKRSGLVRTTIGDSRAVARLFTINTTDRRRYIFADRETRTATTPALERQVAAAKRLHSDPLHLTQPGVANGRV